MIKTNIANANKQNGIDGKEAEQCISNYYTSCCCFYCLSDQNEDSFSLTTSTTCNGNRGGE